MCNIREIYDMKMALVVLLFFCLLLFHNIGMKLFSSKADDFYSDFGLVDVISFVVRGL